MLRKEKSIRSSGNRFTGIILDYYMVKKGIIEEIFSKALYADDPFTYRISFRDFDSIKEVSLPDFLEESDNFETIPVTRIQLIKKNNKILYKKKNMSEKIGNS